MIVKGHEETSDESDVDDSSSSESEHSVAAKRKAEDSSEPASSRRKVKVSEGGDEIQDHHDVDQDPSEELGENAEVDMRGTEEDPFYTVAVDAENGPSGQEKWHVKKEFLQETEYGTVLLLKNLEILCLHDPLAEANEIIPVFAPTGECQWFPARSPVEVDFIRWDEDSKAFQCATVKAGVKEWKRACNNCVKAVFSGEMDACKPATFGTGALKTHCTNCKPVNMTPSKVKFCSECKKKEPEFGWPNSTKKSHCVDCRKKGMVKLNFNRCAHEGCKYRATHGFNGSKTHCQHHKTEEMTLAFKPCIRCKNNKATTGKNDRITHCDTCMDELLAGVKSKKKKKETAGAGRGRPKKSANGAGATGAGRGKAKATRGGGAGRGRGRGRGRGGILSSSRKSSVESSGSESEDEDGKMSSTSRRRSNSESEASSSSGSSSSSSSSSLTNSDSSSDEESENGSSTSGTPRQIVSSSQSSKGKSAQGSSDSDGSGDSSDSDSE